MRFGLINRLGITETRHIPYAVGTHCGFRIDYHDTGHPVTLREQFDLPGPARWHSTSPPEQRMVTSRGGRTLTREVQLGSHTPAPPDVHSLYIEDIQIARKFLGLDVTYSFLRNLVCAFHASENGCRLLQLTAFCD